MNEQRKPTAEKTKRTPLMNLGLTSYDELFTTQAEREEAKLEKIMEIPIKEISDFRNHPFKVRQDEAMMEMAESIRQYGVLVPALVRPDEYGGYEMVAGHRRKLASSLAGKEVLPCIVRKLTDEEATIIMVDRNLQREQVLPSEKAFAYKMKLEAMKQQGQRTDLTSDPVGWKLTGRESAAIVGTHGGDGQTQVRRYIRLTHLIPELLEMVDGGKIALRPAVELSYLGAGEQRKLHDAMKQEDCTPSHVQAIKLRRFNEAGKLTEGVILSIMQEEKPNQKEQFRMPKERIAEFFPAGTPAKKMEETIVEALELYRKRRRELER